MKTKSSAPRFAPNAGCPSCSKLELRIAELEAHSSLLQEKLQFLTRHPLLLKGIQGESIVARLVQGIRKGRNGEYDVLTPSGHKLEIKYSDHRPWDGRSKTRKWQWNKLLGEGGKKIFDYAILVGDADPRYLSEYDDSKSGLVTFAIPFDDIEKAASLNRSSGHHHVHLNTNPVTARQPKAIQMYRCYQCKEIDLVARFGL